MAPFILTRDRIQAQVVGAGYPSLPTYTLEEFYDQKYKDTQPPKDRLGLFNLMFYKDLLLNEVHFCG